MSESRSKVHPKYKTRYRVRNRADYDRALVCRGDLTIWFSPQALAAWKPLYSRLRGGQRRCSDLVIETTLTLRLVSGLPWRQTEGLPASILVLIGVELETHDLVRPRTTPRCPDVREPLMCSCSASLLQAPFISYQVGRRRWRAEVGQHQQAWAENTMFRYKRMFGSRLRARGEDAQRDEILVGCSVLNRVVELGMPDSHPLPR